MSLERGSAMLVLTLKMQAGEALSLENIRALLEATEEIQFKGHQRGEVYEWIEQTLRQIRFRELKRSGRGLVRRYVSKMTGLSRAQTTGLLAAFVRGEGLKPQAHRRYRSPKRYRAEDIELWPL
jgi:hypothetical protein